MLLSFDKQWNGREEMANSKQIHKKSLESYHGQCFKDWMKPGSSEEDLMSTVSHDRLKKKTGS